MDVLLGYLAYQVIYPSGSIWYQSIWGTSWNSTDHVEPTLRADPLEIPNLNSGSADRREPEPGIERLGEGGLDPVEEVHFVRDAVEGQGACTVV